MRRLVRGLTNAGYFLMCFAQIPILAGHFLLGDSLPAIIMLAALLPLSFLLSLLPGKIGGKKKNAETAVVRRERGCDPDPDRALRNEALPLPEKKAFPLRSAACLIASIGVAAVIFFAPVELLESVWWVRRFMLAGIMAIMLPLALKMVALGQRGIGTVSAGIVGYIAAGVIAYFQKDPVLDERLVICGLLFVVVAALSMNNESMARSAAYREGVRPPASMRRRNRVMLAAVVLIGVAVLYFDQIRQRTIAAVSWIGSLIGRGIAWLMSLVPLPEDSGGGGGSGEMDMLAGLESGETGGFWAATEEIIYVVGMLIALVALFFLLKKAGRMLMDLLRRIAARLKKFSDAVGEEYRDEQESLFDWDETKKELGANLRKRLERLTRREKKWDQMDARERVRFVVRSLYRRSPEGGSLRSLTVHEALGRVKTGQAQPEELAEVYDMARYSRQEPDMQTAERLRKEAKV